MKQFQFKAILCVAVIAATGFTSTCAAADLGVAFWNVENLFDTVDDPKVELDEEFTPNGVKKWSATRLELKLANLTRVIGDMNSGKAPDVLGLSEVENRTVLDLLAKALKKKTGRDYRVVHRDSPSFRGIDTAALYDAKSLKLDAHQIHRISKFDTRDILEVRFETSTGSRLTIFVNHWPSRGNPESYRLHVASVLRKRIDEILKSDADADFIILGDLNDTPANESVGKVLNSWGDSVSLKPGVLFNSSWKFQRPRDQGTYVYKNEWSVLDHVILSQGMLDGKGASWVADSTKLVKRPYQMYVSKIPGSIPRPSRSYSGPIFHRTGYSDHLPVECTVRIHLD